MSEKQNRQKLRAVLSDRHHARNLAAHVWRHFREDRCFDEAASLCYTSLLSMVPLLAVVFSIVSAFPVFATWSQQLQDFIIANMVPASGEVVGEYLVQFLGSADKLTLTGTFFLIVTALFLMMRIEKSFNRIWRVAVARSFLNRFVMYWAVLTLGPLALGVATALSAQPLFDLIGATAVTYEWFRTIGIFALTWLAFALMFLLVPNCRVPVSFAALGAFLSTALFSLAKMAFLAYVSRASYSVIYGAIAVIPIFLLWLYLVWVVILLGASLAASLTTFSDRRSDWRWPLAWELLLVFRLLGHFHQAQARGEGYTTEELLELEPGMQSSRMKNILISLMEEKLITQDQDQQWILKRDLARYTLADLYRAGEYHLPIGKKVPVPTKSRWDQAFIDLLKERHVDMDHDLATLYAQAQDRAS